MRFRNLVLLAVVTAGVPKDGMANDFQKAPAMPPAPGAAAAVQADSASGATATVEDGVPPNKVEPKACGVFSFAANHAREIVAADGFTTTWQVYDYEAGVEDPTESVLAGSELYLEACLVGKGAELERADLTFVFDSGRVTDVQTITLPLDERQATKCMVRLVRKHLDIPPSTNKVRIHYEREPCKGD